MNQTATQPIAVTDVDFEQAVLNIVDSLIGVRPKLDYARSLQQLL